MVYDKENKKVIPTIVEDKKWYNIGYGKEKRTISTIRKRYKDH